jgi:hypothetical protein
MFAWIPAHPAGTTCQMVMLTHCPVSAICLRHVKKLERAERPVEHPQPLMTTISPQRIPTDLV